MSSLDMQIRRLSYRVLHQLSKALDPPGPMDWKALIAQMPDGTYTKYEVSYFEMAGYKPGGSSTIALLTDMGQKLKTVKHLVVYLQQLGNLDALEILDVPLEPVEITEQPQSQPVQEGQQLVLCCQARGVPAPQFQWIKNGAEIPHGVDSKLVIDQVKLTDSGDYYCIVSNKKSAEKTNHVEVQVLPAPGTVDISDALRNQCQLKATAPPTITDQPESGLVPVGQPCRIMCRATGDPRYQWYKDGFKLHAQVRTELIFNPFEYLHEGNYTCRVYNDLGDELSNIATLQAASYPTLNPEAQVVGRSKALKETATDKVALIIGNLLYSKLPQGESELVHTASDSQMLASILRKPEMGFKVLSFENLDKEEMEKAVNLFCSLLGEGVYGVVYFAGHGFQEGGQQYLVPVDAGLEWTPEDAVCVQKILGKMHEHGTKFNLLLLDICRKRTETTTEFKLELYNHPHAAQFVIGYATCPQSEAFERRCDANGLYMKHLVKHIFKEEKIEDILAQVSSDVDDEVSRDPDTTRQRPVYESRTSRSYSLRDPIVPQKDDDLRKRDHWWLTLHKLPEKYVQDFGNGIKVEIRFEHTIFSSNVIVLCLRVVEQGLASECDAKLFYEQMPAHLTENHFHLTSTNLLRQIIPQQQQTIARSLPRGDVENGPANNRPLPVERISFIRNIQRLRACFSLTIEVNYIIDGDKQNKAYKVKAFNFNEFGIAKAFA